MANELLHHKRDLESCYFAAQTMRTKIHQSFHELPVEVHVSLRDSLLDHISQINEATNSVIVTQLSLALADLILQMPSWKRATLDLIARFSQSNLWPLLEVLIVLPEELESRSVRYVLLDFVRTIKLTFFRLRLGENRRQEVMEDLKSCAPTLNEFLKHCSNVYATDFHNNVQNNIKIIRCFTSWMAMGAISLQDVIGNVIVTYTFRVLSYKQESDRHLSIPGALHDAATDCVCTLLQCLEDNNNQQDLEMYLFNSVMELEPAYHLSVANEDQEKSINYCRMFTELGESFLMKVISFSNNQAPHYTMKVFDIVLMCVGHHDYDVAEKTFNFWYLLSEALYQQQKKMAVDLCRPYVERLVTALCRHCQMEPDHEGLLEDDDDFKDFRVRVFELIKDIVFIVGSSNCFRQMYLNLQVPTVTWDVTESALFIMQAVAKNVLP